MVERYSHRRDQSEISHFTSSHSFHPSFSSTLLDAIYRSIDEGEEDMVIYSEGMRRKQSVCHDAASVRRGGSRSDEQMADFQRACMIEKWMEKKVTEKVVVRMKTDADLQSKKPRKDRQNSSWSSSDSSCGGGFFSSSEAESFPMHRPKPIRTGFQNEKTRDFEFNRHELEQKPTKHEGGFSKTRLRALKIYGDLKKVKQPISPGGKLAGFLNALFAGGNMKKHKAATNGSDDSPSLKSTNASTCSSASSFSRSCLSKTPSSGGKLGASAKRSVRFSPVSVIVDEDCQPCGHKLLNSQINKKKNSTSDYEAEKNHSNINIIRNVIDEELMAHVMEKKSARVEELAKDLLRGYQRKNHHASHEQERSYDHHLRNSHVKTQVFGQDFDEEEEDDDAASYASSDLFELDNLSSIGMERYREELPVYETTNLDSTVASGLIF